MARKCPSTPAGRDAILYHFSITRHDVTAILMDIGKVKDRSHLRFLCHAIKHSSDLLFRLSYLTLWDESFRGDVFLSLFPFQIYLAFITHQTFCFYFFSSPALSLSFAPQCVSSSDCSHSLRIIIIHIFFRFLINSVQTSVKKSSSVDALSERETIFNNITFSVLISRANVHAYICDIRWEMLSHKNSSSISNFLNNK